MRRSTNVYATNRSSRTYSLLMGNILAAAMVLLSLSLWLAGPLPLDISETPFLRLGPLFFVSMTLQLLVIALSHGRSLRLWAILAVGISTFGVLVVSQPTGRMFDSLSNVAYGLMWITGALPSAIDPYVPAFPVAFLLFGVQSSVLGLSLEGMSALYIGFTGLVYVLLFSALGRTLAKRQLIPQGAAPWFVLAMLVWGPALGLRINPAPATIALILSLLVLFLSLKQPSVPVTICALVGIVGLGLSHPLDPALAALLLAVIGIGMRWRMRSLILRSL